MPKQTITVEFKATKHKQLIKAIHDVANATNKTANAQQEAVGAAKNFDNTGQRVTGGMRNQGKVMSTLTGQFALIRNKLLIAAFAYGLVIP